MDELDSLPVVAQAEWHARAALADSGKKVEIHTHEDEKRHALHVNLARHAEAFWELLGWGARIRATHFVPIDATRTRALPEQKDLFYLTVCAHAVCFNDGSVRSGILQEPEVDGDNYLGEVAGQLVCGVSLPVDSRPLVMFDALSAVQARETFEHLSARGRSSKYMAHWYDVWTQEFQRWQACVFYWQRSHMGVPLNDWPDLEAEIAAKGETILRIPRQTRCSYASLIFPWYHGNLFRAVVDATQAEVVRRLKSASFDTVCFEESVAEDGITVTSHLLVASLSPEIESIRLSLLAERGQLSDLKRVSSVAAKRALVEPTGCLNSEGSVRTWDTPLGACPMGCEAPDPPGGMLNSSAWVNTTAKACALYAGAGSASPSWRRKRWAAARRHRATAIGHRCSCEPERPTLETGPSPRLGAGCSIAR